ncbi:hypothetical protein LSUE1_G002904 [Lachnellula suecica]|uniref:Uncharacterized protein n=1 Tax=Lachnellula suecica TaxID=602035 RepID=A0A8T9CAU7_9HELO|nr:hypothetical protein LSUE1_G002904 [Lachnellula suecica]
MPRYWDFSLDNTEDSFPNSPLFNEVYGFGGNGPYIQNVSALEPQTPTLIPGRTGGGCVDSGPFANLTVPMGLGFSTTYTPHCMRRDFSPELVSLALSDSMIQAA